MPGKTFERLCLKKFVEQPLSEKAFNPLRVYRELHFIKELMSGADAQHQCVFAQHSAQLE